MFCMRLTKMEWIVGSKTLEKLTCKKCGRIQMVDYNMIGPQDSKSQQHTTPKLKVSTMPNTLCLDQDLQSQVTSKQK